MNASTIIVGPPGCGKTTLAGGLVREHLARYACGIVIVHDPVAQFARHGCQSYNTVAEFRARATDRKKEMPRGAAIRKSTAEEVTRLALELGERNNTAHDVRVPILLVYDEGSLLGTSGATWMGDVDNQVNATRRHCGIHPVYNVQQPNQLTQRFYGFSTDVALFRTTRDRAAYLDAALLLERGELERAGIAELPPYRYLHVRLGEGIVSEPLVARAA